MQGNKHGYLFSPLLKASLLLPSGHTGHWRVQCGGTCGRMYRAGIVLISAYHLTHDVINYRIIAPWSSPMQRMKKTFPSLLILHAIEGIKGTRRPPERSLIPRSPPTFLLLAVPTIYLQYCKWQKAAWVGVRKWDHNIIWWLRIDIFCSCLNEDFLHWKLESKKA